MASKPKRIVRYSELAALDREEIFSYTTHQHGVGQAERYAEFLATKAQEAADGVLAAKPVRGVPNALAVFAKWPKARYGHFLIFEREDDGIYMLRVLHSSMDVERRLK